MARFYLDNIPKTPQADIRQQTLNVPNLPDLQAPRAPNYPEVKPRDITSAYSLIQANKGLPENLQNALISGPQRVGAAYGRAASEFADLAGTLGNIAYHIQKSGETANRSRASNIVNRGILAFEEKAIENRWNGAQKVSEWALEEENIKKDLAGIPLSGPEGGNMRNELELKLLRNRVDLKDGMRKEQLKNDELAYTDRIGLALGRGDINDALQANDEMLEGGSQNDTQHAHRKQEILEGGAAFYATRDLLTNPRIVKQEMEEKLSPEGNKGADVYPDMTDIKTIKSFLREADTEIDRRERDVVQDIGNEMAKGTDSKIKKPEDIDKMNQEAGNIVGAEKIKKLKKELLDPDVVYNQEAVTNAEVEVDKYKQEPLGLGSPEYHRVHELIRTTVSREMRGYLFGKLYAKATEKQEGAKLPGADPFSQFIGNVWDDHKAGVFLPAELKGTELKDLDLNNPKERAARDASTERGALIIQALRQWAGDNPDKAKDPVEVKKHLDELYKTDVSEMGKRAIQPPSTSRLQSEPNGFRNVALTTTPVPALTRVRSRFADELQNERVRRLLYARTDAEVGGQGRAAQQAFMETVFNRAAARGQTLAETLVGRYWGSRLKGFRSSRVPAYQEIIDDIAAGSNVSNFATGNWSGRRGRGFGRGGFLVREIAGEQYGVEAGDVGWHRSMRGQA